MLLGQVGTALSQMLIAMLLTRILTPNDYGIFQVIQRIVLFGAVLGSFGMGWGVVRAVADAMAKNNNLLARLQIKNILAIVVSCSIVINFLYLIYGGAVSQAYFHIDLSQETFFVITLVFLTAMQLVLTEAFRGMHNLKLASLFSGPVVNISFLVGIVWFWRVMAKGDLTIVLWVLTVSTGLVVIVSFLNLQSKLAGLPPSSDDAGYPFVQLSKENFRAGASFTATNIVNFFVGQSDVWIVAAFFSVGDVAYYAAASRLAFLMSAPSMLANGTLRPTIVALWSAGEKNKLQSLLRTVATGSVALTIIPLTVVAFYGGTVMEVLFGTFYRDGGNVLFIISLGWFSSLMLGPAGTLMMLVGKQREYFYCTVSSGLVFGVAALILPGYFAVKGVALAVAVAMVVNSALSAIYAWRVMGVKTFCFTIKKGQMR